MKSEYCVVVSINNEVWGTWTLEHEPTPAQQTELRRAISRTLKDSSFPDHQYNA